MDLLPTIQCSEIFLISINLIIVSLVYLVIISVRPYWILMKLPRAPGHLIFGDIKPLLPPPLGSRTDNIGKAGYKLISDLNRNYYYKEKIFVFWVFWYPFVNIIDPRLIEIVLKQNIDKPVVYNIIRHVLGEGILTSDEPKWKPRRRKIQPFFARKLVVDNLQLCIESSKSLVSILSDTKGANVNIFPIFSKIFLSTVIQSSFGVTLDDLDADSEFLSRIAEIGNDLGITRHLNPCFWNKTIFDFAESQGIFNITRRFRSIALELSIKLVDKWTQSKNDLSTLPLLYEEDDVKPSCVGQQLVQMYLNNQKTSSKTIIQFGFQDIMEEVGTLLAGSFEASGWSLTWATYLLAAHPIIQSKAVQEIDRILGSSENDNHNLTIESLKQMTYLEGCIKESLRLFPAFPFIARKAKRDFKINSFEIPKGTSLVIPIFSIHRNPEHYPDPDSFIPERFSSFSSHQHNHSYLYLPFSAGLRGCIGQTFSMVSMKLFLVYILRKFTLRTELPYHELQYSLRFQIKPVQELQVSFDPRSYAPLI